MSSRQSSAKLERHAKKAVDLAMQGLWEEAIAANRALLELAPEDVEAYNRLGRAFMEMGEYVAAKESYERALQLDRYNGIAKKNLKRLSQLGESAPQKNNHKVVAEVFIEDTSKARVVDIVNLGPKETLMRMSPGEKVDLRVEGQRLIAHNEHDEYLGEIEPQYGSRLVKLIGGGNQYIGAIRSLGDNEIKLLIREVYQHPSQADRLSFRPKKRERFHPYVKESFLRPREEDEEEGDEIPELEAFNEITL